MQVKSMRQRGSHRGARRTAGRVGGFARGVRLAAGIVLAFSSLLSLGQGVGGAGGGDGVGGTGGVEQGADAPGGGPAGVPAARQADNVAIITIFGAIDRVTSLSAQRRLDEAVSAGADAIVVEVNSPGGELGAVLEISNAIKSVPVPNTVAWVNNDAYSGGAIIALACREIVVNTPAAFGDAFPITMRPGGVRGLNPDERKKFLPPLLADVTDSARRSGFDEYIVQTMVVDGIELWLVRDRQTGRHYAIDAQEYITLFGDDPSKLTRDQEPIRGKAMLYTIPQGQRGGERAVPGGDSLFPIPHPPHPPHPPTSPTAPDTVPSVPGAEDAPGQAPEIPAGEQPGSLGGADGAMPGPQPPPEDVRFRPAGDALADLESDISMNLETATARPTFTEADRGRYELLGYLTDGSGPTVLRDQELLRLGFAARVVRTDEDLKAFFGAQHLVRLDETWSEALVRFLTSPWVRGALIVVFLIGAFIELASPGIGVAGAIAGLAGVMLLAPPMLIGLAGWWEIAAIGVGILLLMLEAFVLPGFGVFGVAGIAALFLGLLGTFIPNGGALFPDTPGAQSDALYGVVTILLATFTAGVGIFFIAKHIGSVPFLNRLVLASSGAASADGPLADASDPDAELALGLALGDEGVALTPLRPAGRVQFGDAVHDVVSDAGWQDAGTLVRVVSLGTFRIGVEPVTEAGGEPGGEHVADRGPGEDDFGGTA